MFHVESRTECENFDATTAIENSNSEEEAGKSQRKKKTFKDFIIGKVL